MERPNLKCMRERKLERITYSLHTEWSRSMSPGVTSGRLKSLASMLQVAYKNLTSSECLPRLCRVSGLGLQPLLPQTTPLLLPGVPSHTSSPVRPADCIHCRATNCTGSRAAPKHTEALKMVQNERRYCHASILRFAHSETHPSACWRSHRTSKLQHYDKNTEKKTRHKPSFPIWIFCSQ